MTSEVEKPQPVDNSHLDAGIAARDSRAEAEKEATQTAESEQADEQQEAEEDEQNETEESAASEADDADAREVRRAAGAGLLEGTGDTRQPAAGPAGEGGGFHRADVGRLRV